MDLSEPLEFGGFADGFFQPDRMIEFYQQVTADLAQLRDLQRDGTGSCRLSTV